MKGWTRNSPTFLLYLYYIHIQNINYMKNLSQHITESFQVNEDTITYFVAQNAKASLLKDLKGNSVKFTNVSGNKFEIEDTPKASMAIRMTKERFGMQSISKKSEE